MEDSKPRRIWSILGALGLMVVGVLAIALPLGASIALVIIISWMLIFAGVGHLIEALSFTSFGSFMWDLILAVVSIFVGIYMRMHPGMGLTTLTFMVAIYFLVSACTEIALYLRLRPLPNAGWLLWHAILDLILFALIWVHWPQNSSWLIGTFLGIDLLFAGLSRLVSGAPFFHHPIRGATA